MLFIELRGILDLLFFYDTCICLNEFFCHWNSYVVTLNNSGINDMLKMDKIEKRKSLTTRLVVFLPSLIKFTPFVVSFMFLLQCLFLSNQVKAKNNNNKEINEDLATPT